MTELLRVKARWSGFNGAPGYSVLHFRDFEGSGGLGTVANATAAVNKTRFFFAAIATSLPDAVSVEVEREVDVIEDSTGELVNSLQSTEGGVVDGTGGGGYAAAVGAVVNWRTGGIRNGRRIRGRTFIVPLVGGSFNAQGQLIQAVADSILTAATSLSATSGTPDLFVYARPSAAGLSDGTSSVVTGCNVPTLGAVLRSRRD